MLGIIITFVSLFIPTRCGIASIILWLFMSKYSLHSQFTNFVGAALEFI